jgi:predicted phage tail protein
MEKQIKQKIERKRETAPVFVKGYINPFQPRFYARAVGYLRVRTLEEALFAYAADVEKSEGLPAGAVKRYLKYCTAFVNNISVPREDWGIFALAPTDEVICNITPMGGGGEGEKNPLRTALTAVVMIAAIVVSIYATPAAGGALYAALGANGAAFAGALAGAAVMMGGMLLVNAIAPIRLQDMSVDTAKDTAYQITGGQNKLKHWQSVECMLGRMRVAPALCISPYTANDGRDQYWYAAYCWGYCEGANFEDETLADEFKQPTLRSTLNIGDTKFSAFDQSIEQRLYILQKGDKLKLCENIWEEAVNVELKTEWVERTTSRAVKKLNIDVACPMGLFRGASDWAAVSFKLQYKRDNEDESKWRDWLSTKDIPGGKFKVVGSSSKDNRHREGCLYLDYYNETIFIFSSQTLTFSGIKKSLPPFSVLLHYVTCDYANTGTLGKPNYQNVYTVTDMRPPEYVYAGYFKDISQDGDGGTLTITDGRYLGDPFVYDCFHASLRKTYELPEEELQKAYEKDGEDIKDVDVEAVYNIRMKRISPETDINTSDALYWSVIRSKTEREAIRFDYPVAVTELKIKAQEQISSMVNELTGEFAPYYSDWRGGAWGEDDYMRPTSNPASLLRFVLMGKPNERRAEREEIDEESFIDFHVHCEDNGFEYNKYVESATDIVQLASEIAAAGRGFLCRQNGKYAVVFDGPKEYPVQHFTPANSWGFSSTRRFFKLPNAFRIGFFNEDNDWQTDERIVYDDGYGVDDGVIKEGYPPYTTPDLYENMELSGITSPDLIWKLGREYIKAARLRPETHTLKVDMEYLVAGLRDRVKVSHDVLMVGWAYGRLCEIITAEDGKITGARLEQSIEPVELPNEESYGITIRHSANVGKSDSIVEREVTVIDDTVTFIRPFNPGEIEAGDLYSFGEFEKTTEDYIISEITPEEGLNATLKLIAYAPQVYDDPDTKAPPFTPNTSAVILPERKAPTPPNGLNIVETLELRGSLPTNILYFNWSPPVNSPVEVKAYQVRYRLTDSANWTDANTSNAGIEIRGIARGSYTFIVRAISIYNIPSDWVQKEAAVLGDGTPPPDVKGLSSYYIDGRLNIKWLAADDIRPISYLIRKGKDWAKGQWVTKQTLLELPVYTNGVYQIKAVVPSGAESVNPAVISIDNIERLKKNVIAEYNEHPEWGGKTSGFVKDRGTLRFGTSYDRYNIYGEPNIYGTKHFYRGDGVSAIYYASETLTLAEAMECAVNIGKR